MRTEEKRHLALYPGSPADDLPLIWTLGRQGLYHAPYDPR